jgi:hypothetical protein
MLYCQIVTRHLVSNVTDAQSYMQHYLRMLNFFNTFFFKFKLHVSTYMDIFKCQNPSGVETALLI